MGRFRTAVGWPKINSWWNRNALGFHIPKMWTNPGRKCHLQEDPSNTWLEMEVRDFAVWLSLIKRMKAYWELWC
jgi:hypothetical protein